jgi:hypothetical protein
MFERVVETHTRVRPALTTRTRSSVASARNQLLRNARAAEVPRIGDEAADAQIAESPVAVRRFRHEPGLACFRNA